MYEQYYQKGGTYILPVEIFNDLLNEKEELDKEKQELKQKLEEKDRIITNAINFIYKNTNKTMSEEEFMLELLEVLSKEKGDN